MDHVSNFDQRNATCQIQNLFPLSKSSTYSRIFHLLCVYAIKKVVKEIFIETWVKTLNI